MKPVRCAIYTRKSSEEGLEQDFNSLDAQFAACSAYVASQASEGWTLVNQRYDDGGISGGTLERPALQRLLGDIDAGRIDIVVVYKVDRLTRSLLDFAKLVEAFDKAGTSFVSVTQSFNTTTSMGRLTLNMLLSFAQFEREVTAERIRDKLAASKQRGMWMGGTPPLGYRPDGRSLAVVDDHAGIIRSIFRTYLDLGNVRLLQDRREVDGIVKPMRTTKAGRSFGGGPFSRGELYAILGNPIYIGRIRHGKTTYAGLHPAIIEQEVWAAAQRQLRENGRGNRSSPRIRYPSILAGKLFDDRGEPLVAVHANKGKVRYRYYVSRSLHHKGDVRKTGGMRLPAREIEALVIERLSCAIRDPIGLLGSSSSTPDEHDISALVEKAQELAALLRNGRGGLVQTLVGDIIDRIDIGLSEVRIKLHSVSLGRHLEMTIDTQSPSLLITTPATLKRSGLAMRMVLDTGEAAISREPDVRLIGAIAKAHRWWNRLLEEANLTITDLARSEGVTSSYMTRVIRLAFLDPVIITRIVGGKAPAGIDTKCLTQADAISPSWNEQRQKLGFSLRR
ncbi:MAG: recombinase family protein [Novosphingobium sp.]|nr:recombinase family protein [Novosphingobium sp.]